MIQHDQIIEESTDPELKIFEQEVEKLSLEQLQAIAVAEGIFTAETVQGVRDFELRTIVAEATWEEFFQAYYKGYWYALCV
jgi:hypothetical protein